MMCQRHAGRIEHNGQIVGEIAEGEPLIDPDIFDEVQALFSSRSRGGQYTTRSLGGGILTCSNCGGRLVSAPRYKRDGERVPAYKCCKPKGCGKVSIDQAPTDEALRAMAIARLSDPRIAARVSAVAVARDTKAERLRDELAAAQQAEVALTAKLAEGRLTIEAYSSGQPILYARIEKLQAALDEAERAAADVEQVSAVSRLEVAQQWDSSDTERRRALLKRALRLHKVVVRPAGQPGTTRRRSIEDRVTLAPVG